MRLIQVIPLYYSLHHGPLVVIASAQNSPCVIDRDDRGVRSKETVSQNTRCSLTNAASVRNKWIKRQQCQN